MGLTGLLWRREELYVVALALGVGLLAALSRRSRPIAPTSPRPWHRAPEPLH